MKIQGVFNYNEACEKLQNAITFLDKSKSIEYKIYISINGLDEEYNEYEDDYEMTLTEAAKELKHKDNSVLRHAIGKGKFKENEYRLIGKTYLLKASAVERYQSEIKGKRGFAAIKKKSEMIVIDDDIIVVFDKIGRGIAFDIEDLEKIKEKYSNYKILDNRGYK